MNFYPRHIGDYIARASHLTLLEHGVYARLLDIYYSREWRDTVNGNVSDTGGNLLQEVLLNPGDSVSFHGFESIKGGAYGDNSSNYSGDIYTSLQLVRFDPIGRQLPLPSSLWLAGLGLGLMLSRGTKRA